MRLIDADALLKKKDTIYIPPEDPEETWCFGADVDVIYIDDVKNAPTIEARPAVRGEWMLNKDGSGTCKQCGRTFKDVWDADGWQNFCGHCAADMRGDDNEAD